MRDDVALMRELGLNAYRFSIVVEPRAARGPRARSTRAGLDFYDRLVDALLAHGIAPMATLFHWDLPAALDDRGGWLNPDIARLVRRLRVASSSASSTTACTMWATLNEPWVVTDGGYLHGALAPGHRNRFEAPIATHNLLRAHGAAVQAYRADGKHQHRPRREPRAQVSGVRQRRGSAPRPRARDAYMNRQYLDPVFLGRYPRGAARRSSARRGRSWPADDLALIRQPIDFVGINYYTRSVTRYDPPSWPLRAAPRAPEAGDVHRDRLGGVPARAHRHARSGSRSATAIRRSTSPRTAPRSTIRRSPTAAASTIRCASTTCASTSRAVHAAIAAGRRPARLLRLVAARQLRMVARLLEALRHRARRLRRRQKRTPKDSARFYARVIASRGRVLNELQ